jgi:hypothetical protein
MRVLQLTAANSSKLFSGNPLLLQTSAAYVFNLLTSCCSVSNEFVRGRLRLPWRGDNGDDGSNWLRRVGVVTAPP